MKGFVRSQRTGATGHVREEQDSSFLREMIKRAKGDGS
jgi:hypothetical protein